MEGRSDVLVHELKDRMDSSAGKLDFENAPRYRDQLQSIDKIADRQKVLTRGRDDEDLIAYARSGEQVFSEVAYVRQCKMAGHDAPAIHSSGHSSEINLMPCF